MVLDVPKRQPLIFAETSFASEYLTASIQRQKHNEELAMNERKALMGSPEARQRQQDRRNEADIAGTSESITASLQRTRQQMAQVFTSAYYSLLFMLK